VLKEGVDDLGSIAAADEQRKQIEVLGRVVVNAMASAAEWDDTERR
jgi:hypothetical protein